MNSSFISRASFNYRSESERPSVQKIIAEGSRIDRLYLGKFIPLREKKLLDRLLQTRAVYDEAKSDYLSESNNIEKKPGKPCTCDFTDCESLFDFKGRFNKIKRSASRVSRKIGKKTKKSAKKRNEIGEHRKNADTFLSSLSNLSIQSQHARKRKRTSQTHKHKSKKTKGISNRKIISRSASTSAINELKTGISDTTKQIQTQDAHKRKRTSQTDKYKSKKTKEISMHKIISKSSSTIAAKGLKTQISETTRRKQHLKQTQDRRPQAKCFCTLQLKKPAAKRKSSQSSLATYASRVSQRTESQQSHLIEDKTKKEYVKGAYVEPKRKPFKHVQTGGHELRRCFCTLKLKAKKRSESTGRGSVSVSDTHKNIKVGSKTKQNLKHTEVSTKHKQHFKHTQAGLKSGQLHKQLSATGLREKTKNLDPFECAPNVCIPDECNPRECFQIINKSTTSRESNVSLPKIKQKRKHQQHMKRKNWISKESFTALDFYKPVAKKQIQAKRKQEQQGQQKHTVSKESLTSYLESTQTRKEKSFESKEKHPRPKIRTQTKHAQHLKHTQAGRVVKDKIQTRESMTLQPVDNRNQGSLTKINKKDKKQGKLQPFECEPDICEPDYCNPQKCLKIIKLRQGAHIERESKSLGTKPRKARSTSSLTPKHIVSAKTKRVQSTSSRKPRVRPRDELLDKRFAKEIKTSHSTPVRKVVVSRQSFDINTEQSPTNVKQRALPKRPKFDQGKIGRHHRRGSQGDIRHQIFISSETAKNNLGFGTALKRCFCTLKFNKIRKDKKRNKDLSKGTETPPKGKPINAIDKFTKSSLDEHGMDKYTKTQYQNYDAQNYTHITCKCSTEATTSPERPKLKNVSSITRSTSREFGTNTKKHKKHKHEVKSSSNKESNETLGYSTRVRDTQSRSEKYQGPCDDEWDTYGGPTLRITSSLSFSFVISRNQCPDTQDDLCGQDETDFFRKKNKKSGDLGPEEPEVFTKRKYNKTSKVRPKLKRCFCSLQLQDALENQLGDKNVYTVSRMSTLGTNWNIHNKNSLMNTDNQKPLDYNDRSEPESESTYSNNRVISSTSSQKLLCLDSDFSHKLNYFHVNECNIKQIHNFVNNVYPDAQYASTSPFSRTYYTMNVHKTQKVHVKTDSRKEKKVHKTQTKLDPNECAPGVCIPYKCDPYECKKKINKRLGNKSSGNLKQSKKAKGVTIQKAPKTAVTTTTTVTTKKTTESSGQKPVKENKSTAIIEKASKHVTKLKRCFCTLQLQKKKEEPPKPPSPPPPPVEKKVMEVQTEVHECEPNICIPEQCDPYECLLERLEKKKKRQYRRLSTCSCRPKKPRPKSHNQLDQSNHPLSDNHLKTSCSITRSTYPNRQAVKIASNISFSIEFIKEAKPAVKQIQEAAATIKKEKKKPPVKKPSKAKTEVTKTVKKVQVVKKTKKTKSHASTSVNKKKEKTKKTQAKPQPTKKVSTVLKRCFCTMLLAKYQTVETETVTVVKDKGVKPQKEKKKPDLKTTSTVVQMPPTKKTQSVTAKKKTTRSKNSSCYCHRQIDPNECEPGFCVFNKCKPGKCLKQIRGRSSEPSSKKDETKSVKSVKSAKSVKSSPAQKPKKEKPKKVKKKPEKTVSVSTVTTQTPRKVKKKANIAVQQPKTPPAIQYRQAVEIGSNFSFCIRLSKQRKKEIPLKRCYCSKSLNKVVKVYQMTNYTGWMQNYNQKYSTNFKPITGYMKNNELDQNRFLVEDGSQILCIASSSKDLCADNNRSPYKPNNMKRSSRIKMPHNHQLKNIRSHNQMKACTSMQGIRQTLLNSFLLQKRFSIPIHANKNQKNVSKNKSDREYPRRSIMEEFKILNNQELDLYKLKPDAIENNTHLRRTSPSHKLSYKLSINPFGIGKLAQSSSRNSKFAINRKLTEICINNTKINLQFL